MLHEFQCRTPRNVDAVETNADSASSEQREQSIQLLNPLFGELHRRHQPLICRCDVGSPSDVDADGRRM